MREMGRGLAGRSRQDEWVNARMSWVSYGYVFFFFFFQAEDGIRDYKVTGVQTCALPICWSSSKVLLVVESYLNITLIILETWEMHTDDDTGKAYYFNSITKETTWESPVIKRRSNLSAKVSKFHNKDVLCVPFFYSITLCMLSKTLCGGLICKSNSVV